MVDYAGSRATPRLDLGMALHEYRNENLEADFIGTQVLPVMRVGKQAGTYAKILRQSQTQSADTKRALRGKYNRITFGAQDATYSCDNHGLESEIDDAERLIHLSDFDAEVEATMTIWRAVMLAHEQRVAALVQSTATWTGSDLFTDNSSNPWATAATDVIGQVLDAKTKVYNMTGREPNALVLSRANLQNLLANTGILARFPGASLVTEAMLRNALAAIFGLEKLIVGRARYNSAPINETASTFTMANVWSDSYVGVALIGDQNAPRLTPCLGRTILWEDYASELWTVETYREEQSESDVVRVKNYVDEIVHDAYFQHLMQVA